MNHRTNQKRLHLRTETLALLSSDGLALAMGGKQQAEFTKNHGCDATTKPLPTHAGIQCLPADEQKIWRDIHQEKLVSRRMTCKDPR